MRYNTLPLRSKANEARISVPEPPSRKVFNCIVDDTALIAGVKRSTRDGIRKWVTNGAIRLFVPLETLAQLDRLKNGSDRVHGDAREAIKWLDDVTSMPNVLTTGRVQLEGGDEMYSTWEEVEKFLLPETLLSMEESEPEDDCLSEDLESSINLHDESDEASMSSSRSTENPNKTPSSPRSNYSSTSPGLLNASPYKAESARAPESPNRTARNSADLPRKEKSSKRAVPPHLQPLFNHILWRINQEPGSDNALDSFILLTNDPAKQIIAQRFGIRAKRLEQLRDAVGREERDFKNRLAFFKKEMVGGPAAAEKKSVDNINTENIKPEEINDAAQIEEPNSDDEDVVLFKRAPRGLRSANDQRILDPNDFGRVPPPGHSRGGRGGRGGPRGGRGAFVAPTAPRSAPTSRRMPPSDPNQPIDPDSYVRPPPRTAALRGGRRKLWEPK
ncbi:hypothetical protein K432DRAFT_418372 [Lepidopterella palustris CBS 459.81]|uniref:PIN domain-containing protein n=1 Tax=Lepidopterella palustris CBS 459.81 TaxID=1314670 RepID=A0A8E2JCS7_9PEZI|nr:hypothetical protein K432DRAFT_418372 [Lepidopterella palustris CBS 459.81]